MLLYHLKFFGFELRPNPGNPDDSDPYKWLDRFAKISPQIHLKQSLHNNPN